MKRKSLLPRTMLCVGVILGAAACGSSGNSSSPGGSGGSGGQTQEQVEIFSWWVAPGEAEALQALLDLNKVQHPNDHVFNAAADSGSDARAMLADRLSKHQPPDLFQQNAADIPAFLQTNPGTVEPLDDFLAQQALDSAIMPDILKDVTVNGSVYAMPVNIHRENALFYNKQIFKDHDLTPPTTLAEFLNVCQTLSAQGVTPVASAGQGWILRVMFNELAMGNMGAQAFHDFMTGAAHDDAAFQSSIDIFSNVITNYTNAEVSDPNFAWTDAAELVFDGKAAMFLHGDWAKGYYEQLGWTPGVDFGVLGAPGASDLFWYGVDTFQLPVAAPTPSGSFDFLQTIGSIDGQIAFNALKGSTPVRADVPLARLDSESRGTFNDFMNAQYRMLVVSKDVWDNAMQTFAQDGDKAALFQVYVDNPPGQ